MFYPWGANLSSILDRFSNKGPGSPPLITMAKARMWMMSYLPVISLGTLANTSMGFKVMFSGRRSGCGNCEVEMSKPVELEAFGDFLRHVE